MQVYSIFF